MTNYRIRIVGMILACSVLLVCLSSIPASAAGEQQFVELQQCELTNGLTIRPCRIG
ncbi:MAG: hypothetical protein ACI9SC_001377 [Gammaproteobacteria bacterium]|jgi:hypothetical protein